MVKTTTNNVFRGAALVMGVVLMVWFFSASSSMGLGNNDKFEAFLVANVR